jgi:hypothetical protein
MQRKRLSAKEDAILEMIMKQADELPLDLFCYTSHLAAIRARLGIPGRGRGVEPAGFIQQRKVHARPRWS